MDESIFACFDYDGALEVAAGDPGLLCEVAQIFLEESASLALELRRRLDAGDTEGVRRLAHSLKGSACNFHASAVVETSQSLEDAGRDSRLGEAEDLFSALEQHLDALHAELRSLFEE